MRPIKVTAVLPIADLTALKDIHFYPDIVSSSSERATPDLSGNIRYGRYSHEFPVNASYGIIFKGPYTPSGWFQKQMLHMLNSNWYKERVEGIIT